MDYQLNADNNSPIFAEWISITTPSGLVFSLNLREHELPEEIKNFLLSDTYFIGFSFSKALGNTDDAFHCVDVKLNISDCLEAIVDHNLLSPRASSQRWNRCRQNFLVSIGRLPVRINSHTPPENEQGWRQLAQFWL